MGGGGIGIWEENILGQKIGFGGNVFFFGGGRKVGIWRKWVREEMEFWRKRGLGRKRWFWEEERGFEDSGVCEENRRIDFGGNRVWG